MNYQPIAFYDNIDKQYHRLFRAHGRIVGVYAPAGKIPAFQLVVTSSASSVASVSMVNIKTGTSIDVHAQLSGHGLTLKTVEDADYKLVIYPNLNDSVNVGHGMYYLQVDVTGDKTYYSEIITVCNPNGFMQLVWWNDDNFELPEHHFDFENEFFFNAYFKAELGKPMYVYEDTIHRRDGFDFPEKIISLKRYQFEDFMTEPFWDGIRVVRLFDHIRLVHSGGEMQCNGLDFEISWDVDGYIGIGSLVIETNNVVKSTGKTLGEPPPLPQPVPSYTLTIKVQAAGDPRIAGSITFNYAVYWLQDNEVIIPNVPDGTYSYDIFPDHPYNTVTETVTINGEDKVVTITLSIFDPPAPEIDLHSMTIALWHGEAENDLITNGTISVHGTGYLNILPIIPHSGSYMGNIFDEIKNTTQSGAVYNITVNATGFISKVLSDVEVNESFTKHIQLTKIDVAPPEEGDMPKMGYMTNDQFIAVGEAYNLDIIEGNTYGDQQKDLPTPNHTGFPDTIDVMWKGEFSEMEEYLEYHMWIAVPISLQKDVLSHYETIGAVQASGLFYNVGEIMSMHGYIIYVLNITAPVDIRLRRPLIRP